MNNTADVWRRMRAGGWTVARLGAAVPHLLDKIPWPGTETPWAHQRVTTERMLVHDRLLVTSGLGAGKTLSALWATNVLLRLGEVQRVLIVAPIMVCSDVWMPKATAAGLVPANLCGLPRAAKLKALVRHGVCLINPDALHSVRDVLSSIDLMIIDEASSLKHPTSLRHRAVKNAGCKRLWLMTATPSAQNPMDGLGLHRLLHPGKADFISAETWRNETMRQVGTYRWLPKPDAPAYLMRMLQPSIGFRAEECYDVPPVQHLDLPFDLSAPQEKLIKTLHTEGLAQIGTAVVTAVNAGILADRLLQVECGGVYASRDGSREAQHVSAPGFFAAISDVAAEARAEGTSLIVFASHRVTTAAIADNLIKQGLRVRELHGDVPVAARQMMFNDLRRGALDVLVAVPTTMSHGVTLVECSRILWASPPRAVETYLQANGRIVRPGQTRHCTIAHLVGSARTKMMYTALRNATMSLDTLLAAIRATHD